MDIQASVERHEQAIKALRMLQDIERIEPENDIEHVLKQFILRRGTEGAAAEVNRMGLRLPGKTATGPRKYISTDITAIVANTESQTRADRRLTFVAQGLHRLKRHRKSWQAKLECLCDDYAEHFHESANIQALGNIGGTT